MRHLANATLIITEVDPDFLKPSGRCNSGSPLFAMAFLSPGIRNAIL